MYKAYDLIKKLEPKIGEEEAKELIEFIEASKGDIATKTDLQPIRTDLQFLRTELENKIENLKSDLIVIVDSKTGNVKSDLSMNIEKAKVDILKWQFGFWITIIGAIVAIWLSK